MKQNNIYIKQLFENMNEGGLGGHMSHLYEDQELTFGEIKAVFNQATKGKLESVTEKLDGQNIFFTFEPSTGLRFARNIGNIKTGGMGADEVESRWADKPNVAAAFTKAYKIMSAAIAAISATERKKIFNDGKIWYSAEIVGTLNPNVINYDQDAVIFHESGTVYDENGQPLTIDTSKNFARLVSSVNRMQLAIKNSGWKVLSPVMVPLQKLSNDEPLEEALNGLNELMNKYSMSNDNTLNDMFVEKLMSEDMAKLVADEDTKQYLAELIGDFNATITSKKPILKDLISEGLLQQADLPVVLNLIRNAPKLYSNTVEPIRNIITSFAISVLQGVQSYLILNPNEEVKRLKDEVQSAIEHIRSSGGEHQNQILDSELSRLRSLDRITSSMEGIAFKYNGKLYKLTGAFAPINQILGIKKYGM